MSEYEVVSIRNELANTKAKITRFIKFLELYESDLPQDVATTLEANLVDNLKDIINEAKKLLR